MLTLLSRLLVLVVVTLSFIATTAAQESAKPKVSIKASCIAGMQIATGCTRPDGKAGLQEEKCSSARVWLPVGACIPVIETKQYPPFGKCVPRTKKSVACRKDGKVGVGVEVCTNEAIWYFESCYVLIEPNPQVK